MTSLPKQILPEELPEGDKAYQLLLESQPAALFVLDGQRRIVLTNAAGERLARNPREKLLGATLADFFPGVEETIFFRTLRRVMRTGRPEIAYGEFILEKGRRAWFEIRLHPVPGGVATVFHELGQETRSGALPEPGPRVYAAQQAAFRERLQRILGTACQFEQMDSGGIYLFDDATGGLTLACHHGLSPSFLDQVAAYGPDTPQVGVVLEGKPIYTRFYESETISEKVRNLESLRGVAIIPVLHEGKVLGALHVGSHTLDEIPLAFRGVLESLAVQVGDAVAYVRAEEALRESENRYHDLYDSLRDGVAAADLSGHFLESNAAYREMLGYTQEELSRLTYHELTPSKWHQPQSQIIAEQVFTKGYSDIYEKEYIRKDGTVFPVELRTYLMRHESGAPTGTWAILRDITERKRVQERVQTLSHELLRAQEKERRRISRDLHDQLAQDLAGLKMGLQSLRVSSSPLPEGALSKVDVLLARLQGTIQYVRELSYMLHPAGLEHFGLVHTVQAYCDEFKNKTGLGVILETVDIGQLDLEPEIGINLFRVIQEGLRNVEKHAQAKNVKIRLSVVQNDIILRIEDDGGGFNVRRRELSAIAEKRMGLRSMRERVALMGGRIRIGSRPGKGSTIHVRVPVSLEETPA